MQNRESDKNVFPIKPLLDTWGFKGAGDNYWAITSSFDFTSLSTHEVNDWFATVVVETLEAFADLARVWQISFSSLYKNDVEPVWLEWKPEDSYEEYLENSLKAIRQYSAPIYSLELKVDLFVYVRTNQSPEIPIQSWIRELANFVFLRETEYSKYSLNFKIYETLFHRMSPLYGDNTELYYLNYPLLSHALRLWEKKLGAINELNGSGIFQYGFLS